MRALTSKDYNDRERENQSSGKSVHYGKGQTGKSKEASEEDVQFIDPAMSGGSNRRWDALLCIFIYCILASGARTA